MTDEDYNFIRTLLRDRTAISLDDGKRYLVESRLTPVIRQHNLASIGDMVKAIRSSSANGLQRVLVEAMVTTESTFFRDIHPFDALRKSVLPELMQLRSRTRTLNIWCAACSTGQEPYSLAMLIREYLPELVNWKINLLATDLSQTVLDRAREGVYSQIEVNRGLPAALLVKFFQQHGTSWQIKPEIRNLVQFRELNLAQPWPVLPRMDLVLMRNVLIYFDTDVKKAILARISPLLQSDGYLLLGAAETTLYIDPSYQRVEHLKTGFYRAGS